MWETVYFVTAPINLTQRWGSIKEPPQRFDMWTGEFNIMSARHVTEPEANRFQKKGFLGTVDDRIKRPQQLDGHLKIDFLPVVKARYKQIKKILCDTGVTGTLNVKP